MTFCVLFVFWKVQSFKSWCISFPPEYFVALHGVRFIGFYFLFLYREQRLPYEFAVVGGWGDIGVAVLALLIVLHRFLFGALKREWLLAWNVIGLIDILYVVTTAARLGMHRPNSMQELTHLPLSLLPLFIVPLIISSHVVLFFVLLRNRD